MAGTGDNNTNTAESFNPQMTEGQSNPGQAPGVKGISVLEGQPPFLEYHILRLAFSCAAVEYTITFEMLFI